MMGWETVVQCVCGGKRIYDGAMWGRWECAKTEL